MLCDTAFSLQVNFLQLLRMLLIQYCSRKVLYLYLARYSRLTALTKAAALLQQLLAGDIHLIQSCRDHHAMY